MPTARMAWAQYISFAKRSIAFSRIVSGVIMTHLLLVPLRRNPKKGNSYTVKSGKPPVGLVLKAKRGDFMRGGV
jgi:hypothetical protein